jgi:hypothetical protein
MVKVLKLNVVVVDVFKYREEEQHRRRQKLSG